MADATFEVTDTRHTLPVRYRGVLPDLFREGQGVVAEGTLGRDGVFAAREVLAKHDENYMPPEVADALKKSGHWQDGAPRARRAASDRPQPMIPNSATTRWCWRCASRSCRAACRCIGARRGDPG